MKQVFVIAVFFLSGKMFAQEVNVLLKEATNLEYALKDEQALAKYKEILATDPVNMQALLRSSELCSDIGGRQKDKAAKEDFYGKAKDFAEKALPIDANNADAN